MPATRVTYVLRPHPTPLRPNGVTLQRGDDTPKQFDNAEHAGNWLKYIARRKTYG